MTVISEPNKDKTHKHKPTPISCMSIDSRFIKTGTKNALVHRKRKTLAEWQPHRVAGHRSLKALLALSRSLSPSPYQVFPNKPLACVIPCWHLLFWGPKLIHIIVKQLDTKWIWNICSLYAKNRLRNTIPKMFWVPTVCQTLEKELGIKN